MIKGKLIVIYGINNLGKSTQAKLLTEKIQSTGRKTEYIKYALYDLEPSGPFINDYLRGGNPYHLSPREAQIIYALNRAQYEPTLKQALEDGINVVAEDYWGTGVAWGMGTGVEKDFLLKLNSQFYPADLSFLFIGSRFTSAIEDKHLHERDEVLTGRVAKAHDELGQQFGWKRINASQSGEKVGQHVWQEVK